jgi:hypothetical protein
MSGLPKSSQPVYLILPGALAIAAYDTDRSQLDAAMMGRRSVMQI